MSNTMYQICLNCGSIQAGKKIEETIEEGKSYKMTNRYKCNRCAISAGQVITPNITTLKRNLSSTSTDQRLRKILVG